MVSSERRIGPDFKVVLLTGLPDPLTPLMGLLLPVAASLPFGTLHRRRYHLTTTLRYPLPFICAISSSIQKPSAPPEKEPDEEPDEESQREEKQPLPSPVHTLQSFAVGMRIYIDGIGNWSF